METNDIRFLDTLVKVIKGKAISDTGKEKIREYIMNRHKTEIENLQECDCSVIMNQTYKQSA